MTHYDNKLSTGVSGLDEILHGGLVPYRTYLISGGAGSGKTTLGLHYLIENPDANSLFISLGESEAYVSVLPFMAIQLLVLAALLTWPQLAIWPL